jgi:uncharacterized protein
MALREQRTASLDHVNDPRRVPRTDDNWIRTFTGRRFWPLNPLAEDVAIEDIAHHLALINRFAGATYEPYSVAEHSVRVSLRVERMILDRIGGGLSPLVRAGALWGLLHDAPEAYLVDIPRPVKHDPRMAAYRTFEDVLEETTAEAFGLALPMPAIVKEADLILCNTEKRDLVRNGRSDRGIDRLPETIYPLSWQEAERRFLIHFEFLTGKAAA